MSAREILEQLVDMFPGLIDDSFVNPYDLLNELREAIKVWNRTERGGGR